MKITSLYSYNFRNLASCDLALGAMVNVFYGANAQGKTNLLEALYYASCGLSHRTGNEEELIKIGERELSVFIDYEDERSKHRLKVKRWQEGTRGRKEIEADGARIAPKAHYRSSSVVLFAPEDLLMVKGEPALRRRYLDMQLSQTDPLYLDLLLRYNKTVQQRNKLLKDIRDEGAPLSLLLPWDEEFCRLAAAIAAKRLAAIEVLKEIAAAVYSSLSDHKESLELAYRIKEDSSFSEERPTAETYAALLDARRREDIGRGSTGIGPHRDDLLLALSPALNMRSFASQGQQRCCVLALKLAQLEYSRREKGNFPMLLLDDVMSELDGDRRKRLLHFIDGKVQTFITVNDKALIPPLPGSAFFRVREGRVFPE